MSDNLGREHRTVSRVTTILEAVAAARPDGVKLVTLSTLLQAPKSSIHGLIKGLIATGYLQERDSGYILGPAVGMLLLPSRPSLLVQAHRSLEVLREASQETATLATLVGGSVVYVDIVEAVAMIRYSAPLRVRRPLYPTSSGKCFLAFMNPSKRAEYLDDCVDSAERAAVEAELDAVRREGFAYNRGETVPDVYAVASPILVGDRPTACLSVAGPSQRMSSKMQMIADLLLSESRNVARSLS